MYGLPPPTFGYIGGGDSCFLEWLIQVAWIFVSKQSSVPLQVGVGQGINLFPGIVGGKLGSLDQIEWRQETFSGNSKLWKNNKKTGNKLWKSLGFLCLRFGRQLALTHPAICVFVKIFTPSLGPVTYKRPEIIVWVFEYKQNRYH